jgi:hypothetical protein
MTPKEPSQSTLRNHIQAVRAIIPQRDAQEKKLNADLAGSGQYKAPITFCAHMSSERCLVNMNNT